MCDLCTKHGEGKIWYKNARNYAEDLLSDLERRRYIENFLTTAFSEGFRTLGRLETIYRKKGKLPEPDAPPTWRQYELQEVVKVTLGYAFSSKDFSSTGVPAIKISNVQYGVFEKKNQEYLPASFLKAYTAFTIHPGTLLMALTRPITNKTLKVCIYPANGKAGL